MKAKVYKFKDEFFATMSDLARKINVNEVSLRSYIRRNKITQGTFEYRNNVITVI